MKLWRRFRIQVNGFVGKTAILLMSAVSVFETLCSLPTKGPPQSLCCSDGTTSRMIWRVLVIEPATENKSLQNLQTICSPGIKETLRSKDNNLKYAQQLIYLQLKGKLKFQSWFFISRIILSSCTFLCANETITHFYYLQFYSRESRHFVTFVVKAMQMFINNECAMIHYPYVYACGSH